MGNVYSPIQKNWKAEENDDDFNYYESNYEIDHNVEYQSQSIVAVPKITGKLQANTQVTWVRRADLLFLLVILKFWYKCGYWDNTHTLLVV